MNNQLTTRVKNFIKFWQYVLGGAIVIITGMAGLVIGYKIADFFLSVNSVIASFPLTCLTIFIVFACYVVGLLTCKKYVE